MSNEFINSFDNNVIVCWLSALSLVALCSCLSIFTVVSTCDCTVLAMLHVLTVFCKNVEPLRERQLHNLCRVDWFSWGWESIAVFLLCTESLIRSAASVVCIRWHGDAVATHGSWPHDVGLFPRVNHAVRCSAETIRCSSVRPSDGLKGRHFQ